MVQSDCQHHETDGAGAKDGDSLALERRRQAHGVHGSRQRLDEDGLAVVELVRDRVQAVGRDGEGIGHAALRVAAAEECQVLAEVLATGATLLAAPARQGGLDDHTLADGRPGRPLRCLDHDAENLMARRVWQRNEGMPAGQRVDVRAADAGGHRAHQCFSGHRRGHRDAVHLHLVIRRDDDAAHHRRDRAGRSVRIPNGRLCHDRTLLPRPGHPTCPQIMADQEGGRTFTAVP